MAKYRGLRFAQLLYAGDSLASERWDARDWMGARELREGLLRLSAAGALALHGASDPSGPSR